jgi:DNA repair exonuclease SbcCD ATPase subunit
MIIYNTVTAKNFLSIGNVTQAVTMGDKPLTLVIGNNLDMGGEDSGNKNGVGKTCILNALSYALYGQALTNIKRDNLINKTNGKNMLVTTEFTKNDIKYRIERGRKPNILKLFINDKQLEDSTEADDSQGDSRETQKSIEQLLEMTHTMFKHLVALNTYTEPFLSMKAAEQREVSNSCWELLY